MIIKGTNRKYLSIWLHNPCLHGVPMVGRNQPRKECVHPCNSEDPDPKRICMPHTPPPPSESDISISAYVPVHLRQTNNTAELLAVIRALQIFTFGKVAICTDSEYVFLGATGAARRWKLRGRTGSNGPVSNVPLWELLLDTLSTHTGSIKFIKVLSHVDILGNNEADRLADQGRLSHPRRPVLRTPSRDFTATVHTPPIKRRRRKFTPLPSSVGAGTLVPSWTRLCKF